MTIITLLRLAAPKRQSGEAAKRGAEGDRMFQLLSVYIYIYIYTHISIYLSIYLSLSLYIYIYIYIYTPKPGGAAVLSHSKWSNDSPGRNKTSYGAMVNCVYIYIYIYIYIYM